MHFFEMVNQWRNNPNEYQNFSFERFELERFYDESYFIQIYDEDY